MPIRSGFVCILGKPNAGKSTLLNALAGQKLAIVSPKPQTTRTRVQGIVNIPKRKGQLAAQIILIDTPGVHKADSSLGRKMMREVHGALEGCDLIYLICDATKRWDAGDEFLLEMAKKSGTPVFLLLNKIDLLDKQKLLSTAAEYLRVLTADANQFQTTVEAALQEKVNSRMAEAEEKGRRIQALSQEILKLQEEIGAMQREIGENKEKLTASSTAYVAESSRRKQEIEADIQKINHYIH